MPREGIDGTICSEHCICLEISFSGKEAKQLKQDYKEFIEPLKKEIQKLKVPAIFRLSLQQHIIKKRIWLFVVDLDSIKEEGINEKDFLKPLPFMQKLFDLLEKYYIKKYNGTACTTFIFDSKNFFPVGGFILPTKLNLSKDLIKQLGETELSSFILDFKKSPIGLSNIQISLKDERLIVKSSIEYELTTVKDLVDKTFAHAKQVSILFVEERK